QLRHPRARAQGVDPVHPVRAAVRGRGRGREALPEGRVVPFDLICIGASWGGLRAVRRGLADLPRAGAPPAAVSPHRHHEGGSALAALLGEQIRRPVLDVEDKARIEPRHVYVAPPDYHLLVEPGSFALSVDERVQHARPSIDVLFESAAEAYGDRVIGVI